MKKVELTETQADNAKVANGDLVTARYFSGDGEPAGGSEKVKIAVKPDHVAGV